jgi:membrane protease YdiL (CAAX protease family)
MHIVDHIFIVLLFVAQPIHGAYSYRRYLRRLEAGTAEGRISLYRQTLTLEWVAFAVVAGAWLVLSRPFAPLGFVASSTLQLAGGLAVLALVTLYLVHAWRKSRRMSPEEKARQASSFGSLIHLMPQDDRDYRHFVGVSITAGIVEEFLYRGFTFWYLAFFMPVWAVVIVSSLAFGLGHTYQGASGVLRVTLIGLAFGAFYVFTGSIWLPMLAHAVLDIVQGASILEVLRKSDVQPVAETPAAGSSH